MLMVWPQFGITASAADGISRFISTEGARQGQSSSPVRISVGTVSALHLVDQVVERRPLGLHAELRVGRAQRRVLGQLLLELGEAARVLVLELHARRAVGVFLGELLHAARSCSGLAMASTSALELLALLVLLRAVAARRPRPATAPAPAWRKPKCSVAKPPIDRPTTCALSIFRCVAAPPDVVGGAVLRVASRRLRARRTADSRARCR